MGRRMVFESGIPILPLIFTLYFPSDMGINQAGFAITDEGAVKAACVDEVKRRAERYKSKWEWEGRRALYFNLILSLFFRRSWSCEPRIIRKMHQKMPIFVGTIGIKILCFR